MSCFVGTSIPNDEVKSFYFVEGSDQVIGRVDTHRGDSTMSHARAPKEVLRTKQTTDESHCEDTKLT